MQKITTTSIIREIKKHILILLVVLTIFFSLFLISNGLLYVKNTTNRIYSETLDHQSELIKSEILIVTNMIYHYLEHNYDRDKILDYLRKIRFGENQDGYIFIVSYDGTTILNDTKRELEGINIWDMEDPNGINVIQEERKAVENPDGDFIYYSWEQPSTGKITPKISFIKGIPEWGWMVGTGVYLDSIEKETALQVKQIYKKLYSGLTLLFFIMIIIFLFIYIKFKKITFFVSEDISFINDCFNEAETDSEIFDINRIKYDEFSIIARHANEMITRQQKAEKEKQFSELRSKMQREQSPLAYVGWDLSNKIVEWNPAAEDMFGYTAEDAIGEGFELIIPNHETTGVEDVFSNLVKIDSRKKNINQNITKDGRLITCEWYNNNLIDNNGDTLGISAIGIDITRRLKSQEEIAQKNIKLEKSLKENMVLIREVHHRVKNNMAIISSLLALQSNGIKNEELKKLLQSSQNRIQTMAMVHEHIYRNEELHDVNVREYLTELIEYLMISFGGIEYQVSLNIDVDDINLELDTLIPLGMLVNEIVSNSFKYAFNSEGLNKLSVILHSINENKYYLYISDNGSGFKTEDSLIRQGSIGLKLIKGLVEQIDGRLKITTEEKTAYEIYF